MLERKVSIASSAHLRLSACGMEIYTYYVLVHARCYAGSKDKDKDEDSFLLKMGAHIVKNLLVRVLFGCMKCTMIDNSIS